MPDVITVAHEVFDELETELPSRIDLPASGISPSYISDKLKPYGLPATHTRLWGPDYLKGATPVNEDTVWIMSHQDTTTGKNRGQLFMVGWWKSNGEFGGVDKVIYYGWSGEKKVAPYSGWNWRKNLIQTHWGRYPPKIHQFHDLNWFSKAFGELDGMGNVADDPWARFSVFFTTIPVDMPNRRVLNWNMGQVKGLLNL